MSRGGVLVRLPQPALAAAAWRVEAGGAAGRPGEVVAVPAGDCDVVVTAEARRSGARIAARIRATVPVAPDRTTCVRIPLCELLLR